MGMTKRLMEDREAVEDQAQRMLLKAGRLVECESHGDIYDDEGDMEEAYELAREMYAKGELHIGDVELPEFLSIMQKVLLDNSTLDGCPSCERNRHS